MTTSKAPGEPLLTEADQFIRKHFLWPRRLAMAVDRWSAAKNQSQILFEERTRTPRGKRLCIFSHFDRRGRIDPYVLHYLRDLYRADFDVVLVSTANTLDPNDLKEARELCVGVVRRTNISMDFGSWKVGLDWWPQWPDYSLLVLANDSVYGPLGPLAPIVERMQSQTCDFWGMTDCLVMGYHLQSYFLAFKAPVISSDVFRKFWQDFVYFKNKDNVIRDYETGLSQELMSEGYVASALCPISYLEDRIRQEGPQSADVDWETRALVRTSSPPIALWKPLMRWLDYPFIKQQLVRDNPHKLSSLAEIRPEVERRSTYDFSLVINHLRALGVQPPGG